MHFIHLEARRDSPWYLEVPPSPDLSPWVSHFRVIRGRAPASTASAAIRLLPDGCSGVVIDCGPSAQSSPPIFVGVMHTASVVTFDEHREVIGVRFRPGGALPFVTPSLDELTGRRVALPLLWGSLAQQMGNAVRSAASDERLSALERYLHGRIRQQQSTASRRRATMAREAALVSRAVAHLSRERAARVPDVAAALEVGPRRLERIFNRTVGVPPKVFHRMRRCCEAARLIRRTCGAHEHKPAERTVARCNWSAIGAEAGYADQAHFIREFRALTGVTPVAYAAEYHPVGFMQYDRIGAR